MELILNIKQNKFVHPQPRQNLLAALCLIVCTIVCSENIIAQTRYSVVISEIMADPTPQVSLPNAEWLELRNASGAAINLQGFRLQKAGNGPSGTMPSFVLQPDSSVIVCAASQAPALSVFGSTISVTSFPSLGNEGDQLILLSPSGSIVHAVEYSNSWYRNAVKAEGGWTLEMIDTRNPCSGSDNWQASSDPKGGTPGAKNAADRINADNTAPRLLRASAVNAQFVQLVFDEPLDSSKAAIPSNYTFTDGINVSNAIPVSPLFNRVSIFLNSPISSGKVYTVNVDNISDCAGNTIDNNFSTAKTGLYSLADTNDVVVNEILFNPTPPGSDYVELYNRSNKIINLQQLILGNRSSTNGQLGNLVPITAENYPLFPNEFIVLTDDVAAVSQQYTVLNPQAMLKPASMPSLPDEKGWAVVLNNAGKIIDELAYTDQMHFALVANKEGVALERIDYDKPTTQKDNWTSAASTAKFGTPTTQNSQFKTPNQTKGEVTINPKIFSPDNDGYEDFTLVQFRFPQAGYVANITIMDAAGRPVRVLQRNTTCAASGSFRWDGLDDKMQRVPIGTYIILTEIFNLQGQKQSFKNTAVVAKKF